MIVPQFLLKLDAILAQNACHHSASSMLNFLMYSRASSGDAYLVVWKTKSFNKFPCSINQ